MNQKHGETHAHLVIALCLVRQQRGTARAGDHVRALQVGELTRSYLVHVPKTCQRDRPAPVVLAFHGATMNADMMASYSGLNAKADQAGFIVVYPNGTGGQPDPDLAPGGLGQSGADDLAFIARLLDDLAVSPTSTQACLCHRRLEWGP